MKYVMVSKMWNSHFNVQQNLKIVLFKSAFEILNSKFFFKFFQFEVGPSTTAVFDYH